MKAHQPGCQRDGQRQKQRVKSSGSDSKTWSRFLLELALELLELPAIGARPEARKYVRAAYSRARGFRPPVGRYAT